jgi:putative ABC transport system ATP-binding protein
MSDSTTVSPPAGAAGRPDERESALDLRDLRLDLTGAAGPVTVLDGITLNVARGTHVAILGPSGSGKTSLLMVCAGLEAPTAGRLHIAGEDVAALGESDLARFRREKVGIVFQQFHLVATMTALENVAVPLEFAGRGDAFDQAASMLTRVGLGHRAGHYPSQLSGGEQQRVALARALAVDPAVLLADEPTGNLDQATGAKVIDLMFDLTAAHGATLVLVTHDPGLAARCDRQVRLQDGRVIDDRPGDDPANGPADGLGARPGRAAE